MTCIGSLATVIDAYYERGFAIIDECLPATVVARFSNLLEEARQRAATGEAVSNSSGVYALRNLIDVVPEIVELVRTLEVTRLVVSILGPAAFAVRSTMFDKTDGANWGVFWHQDLSIAVKARHANEGFHSWTCKAGIHCVQPPAEIMSRILTVRLHLDDCTTENGALKVLPGSHRSARLTTDRIEQLKGGSAEVVCEVPAGGALLMSPLLLHSSSPMNRSGHRRVIHLEFAAEELPAPLEWRYRICCLQHGGTSIFATSEDRNPRRRSGGTTVVDN